MREILFRGKRIATGNWVEGSLLNYGDGDYDICSESGFPGELNKYAVYPGTIGQFTSLTDKKGKKIFEGDIIQYVNSDEKPVAVIKYGADRDLGLGFYAKWESTQPCLRQHLYFWATQREIEIIGNIHDNPKLLEVPNGQA